MEPDFSLDNVVIEAPGAAAIFAEGTLQNYKQDMCWFTDDRCDSYEVDDEPDCGKTNCHGHSWGL